MKKAYGDMRDVIRLGRPGGEGRLVQSCVVHLQGNAAMFADNTGCPF